MYPSSVITGVSNSPIFSIECINFQSLAYINLLPLLILPMLIMIFGKICELTATFQKNGRVCALQETQGCLFVRLAKLEGKNGRGLPSAGSSHPLSRDICRGLRRP